jgi:hypothetical protein
MFTDCCGRATIVASGQPLPTGNLRLSPSPRRATRAAAHGLAAQHARVLLRVAPSKQRVQCYPKRGAGDPQGRAQGKPGARSTHGPCAKGSKRTVVTTVAPEITRLSPRNGFNGFLRALLGDEFLLSPSPRGLLARRTRLGRPHLRKDLASATDAGTTRLRRTQLHRSSCAPVVRSQLVRATLQNHARASHRVHRIPPRVS